MLPNASATITCALMVILGSAFCPVVRAAVCGAGLGSDANGNCVPCNDALCSDCDTDHLNCLTCRINYGMDASSRRCSQCWDQNCRNCTEDSSRCTQCFQGYGFSAEGSCTKCPEGCTACENNRCSACVAGYGLSPAGTCQPCKDSSCFTCSNNYASCDMCRGTKKVDRETGSCVDTCPGFSQDTGASCVPCLLMWTCSSSDAVDPYTGPRVAWRASECSTYPEGIKWPVNFVEENNTWCGACSHACPVPLPLSFDQWDDISSAVMTSVLSMEASLAPGGAVCPEGQTAITDAASIAEALGLCGKFTGHGSFSVGAFDARMWVAVPCSGGASVRALVRGVYHHMHTQAPDQPEPYVTDGLILEVVQ